jgi:hypothetical protein
MKKFMTIVVAVVVSIGVISATASADKGRRLSGPFCINNNTGVVRSVAITQINCPKGETYKTGVAVPCSSVTVRLKPTNPCVVQRGKQGPKGAKGETGKAGANGTPGSAGLAGPSGPTGLQGPAGPAGAKGEVGARGDTGATGAAGLKGDKGEKGDAGTGLGDGYRWICKIGQGQGSLKDGGTGTNPDCVPGTDFAFKVVTIGPPVEMDS